MSEKKIIESNPIKTKVHLLKSYGTNFGPKNEGDAFYDFNKFIANIGYLDGTLSEDYKITEDFKINANGDNKESEIEADEKRINKSPGLILGDSVFEDKPLNTIINEQMKVIVNSTTNETYNCILYPLSKNVENTTINNEYDILNKYTYNPEGIYFNEFDKNGECAVKVNSPLFTNEGANTYDSSHKNYLEFNTSWENYFYYYVQGSYTLYTDDVNNNRKHFYTNNPYKAKDALTYKLLDNNTISFRKDFTTVNNEKDYYTLSFFCRSKTYNPDEYYNKEPSRIKVLIEITDKDTGKKIDKKYSNFDEDCYIIEEEEKYSVPDHWVRISETYSLEPNKTYNVKIGFIGKGNEYFSVCGIFLEKSKYATTYNPNIEYIGNKSTTSYKYPIFLNFNSKNGNDNLNLYDNNWTIKYNRKIFDNPSNSKIQYYDSIGNIRYNAFPKENYENYANKWSTVILTHEKNTSVVHILTICGSNSFIQDIKINNNSYTMYSESGRELIYHMILGGWLSDSASGKLEDIIVSDGTYRDVLLIKDKYYNLDKDDERKIMYKELLSNLFEVRFVKKEEVSSLILSTPYLEEII